MTHELFYGHLWIVNSVINDNCIREVRGLLTYLQDSLTASNQLPPVIRVLEHSHRPITIGIEHS
jgi:hypothetical protein